MRLTAPARFAPAPRVLLFRGGESAAKTAKMTCRFSTPVELRALTAVHELRGRDAAGVGHADKLFPRHAP